ncbi:unnamed protein product [Orchesella dallaii]|uniref:Uncharacterized protein n=1 Tax=Orchesella dallaii TaxID=48710 RepID=A0ABP1RDB7_9HEXA
MGYFQDNFPGSPAARQRLRLAKGLVIYSVVTGVLIYKFAPAIRRYDKEIAEGRVPIRSMYLDYIAEKIKGRGVFGPLQPTTDQLIAGRQEQEREERSDFAGPHVSPELIKKITR